MNSSWKKISLFILDHLYSLFIIVLPFINISLNILYITILYSMSNNPGIWSPLQSKSIVYSLWCLSLVGGSYSHIQDDFWLRTHICLILVCRNPMDLNWGVFPPKTIHLCLFWRPGTIAYFSFFWMSELHSGVSIQ